jgi:hypothetical protein
MITIKTLSDLEKEWGPRRNTLSVHIHGCPGMPDPIAGRFFLTPAQARAFKAYLIRKGVFDNIRKGIGKPRKNSKKN